MTDAETTSGRPAQGSRIGTVRSISGDKTVSVVADNLVRHRRYQRYIPRRTTLAVHDPGGQARVGDVVEVVPCRPISKTKAWRLVRVVRRPAITQAEVAGTDKG
jgi:small subunit ribosomal protein S17